MTDVERFFRRLVSTLAATDPARLHRPLPLDEIAREILPYRANRRALQLDTSEDYELVLLRLCAGEGSLVRTEPEEARARFAQEIRSAHPDLGVLHTFANVHLTLRSEPLAWALAPQPGAAEPELELGPDLVLGAAQEEPTAADELAEPDELPGEEIGPTCVYCGGSLPVHRPVNFCPHCGQSQTQILCPECRGELEPGWRHCVNCGAAIGEA